MTPRAVAALIAAAGLVVAFLCGLVLPVWLRGLTVGGITGAFGVYALMKDSPDGRIHLTQVPLMIGYGVLIGIAAALGTGLAPEAAT